MFPEEEIERYKLAEAVKKSKKKEQEFVLCVWQLRSALTPPHRQQKMLKKMLARGIMIVLFSILISSSVFALDYFSYQMNIPPGEARNHIQTITYTGSSLKVTIPINFTLVEFSDGGTFSGSIISWGHGINKEVNYTIRSPSDCTEGDMYYSEIWLNDSYYDRFVFVCIPDNKIVDYKLEYGHGDANYLTEDYISDEPVTLFNLIRVFNIGHFLDKDAPANNANINCTFEKYPVRTYGRAEVEYFTDYIKGAFLWDIIESGYWFRIGVLSQDVSGKAVGDFYHINCSELTYDFPHARVRAGFVNKSIEIRGTEPFQIDVSEHEDRLTYTIQNIEEYTAKNSIIEWNLGGKIKRENPGGISPSEIIKYDIYLEGESTLDLNMDFIPSWYANSRNPMIYTQTHSYFYNLTDNPAKITDAKYVILKKINKTVTNIRTSQQTNFRVEMSDFGEVAAGQQYIAKVWIYDHEGKPKNADSIPTITLYDPVRTIIVQDANVTLEETGIYTYTFNLTSDNLTPGQTDGIWEAIVTAVVGGTTVKPSDFWELESSPAEVKINSIVDRTIPTIIADVTITNEGSAGQEYQYEYCIVAEETNACGGGDDVDYASGAKFIAAGVSWNTQLTLDEVNQLGKLWFKLVVYFGTERSGASQSFIAVEAPPPVAPGAGGRGYQLYQLPKPKVANISIVDYPGQLNLIQGESKLFSVTIENTGESTLKNIQISLATDFLVKISPSEIQRLRPNGIEIFLVELKIPEETELKDYQARLKASSQKITAEKTIILTISEKHMKPELESKTEKLKREMDDLTDLTEKIWNQALMAGAEGKDVTQFLRLLNGVKDSLAFAEIHWGNGNYIEAGLQLDKSKRLLENAVVFLGKIRYAEVVCRIINISFLSICLIYWFIFITLTVIIMITAVRLRRKPSYKPKINIVKDIKLIKEKMKRRRKRRWV